MKKLLLVLIALPALLIAQNNKPIGNFYLDENMVIYRHVFNDSIDSSSVIIQKLMAQVPASPCMNNVNEFKNGTMITGTYESQSANDGGPWEMVKGYFIIEIKNGKYRVTISNILDNKNLPTMPFTYLYAKNKPLEWRSGAEKDLAKLDAEFTNAFMLKQVGGKNNW